MGNGKVVVTSAAAYAGDTKPGDFVIDPSLDWVTIPVASNVDFAFILFDTSTNTKWTANNSGAGVASAGYANSTNLDDHMVTFQLTSNHYLIGWEDRPLSGAGSVDLDYNDFVAEVMFVQPVPVPVPAAAWMLGSALIAGLGVPRLRRGES